MRTGTPAIAASCRSIAVGAARGLAEVPSPVVNPNAFQMINVGGRAAWRAIEPTTRCRWTEVRSSSLASSARHLSNLPPHHVNKPVFRTGVSPRDSLRPS